MKKFPLFALATAILLIAGNSGVFAQKKQKKTELKTYTDSVSYIIGADIGSNLKKNFIDINLDVFIAAFLDAGKGADTLITPEQKQQVMTRLQQEIQAKQQAKQAQEAQAGKDAGRKFLNENRSKPGVVETPSGLQYKVLTMGAGPKPGPDDEVTVNYEGRLLDGKIFDSSYERNQSASFPLTGVIKGWTEGLQLMNTGSVYEFYIPSDLAYGDKGVGQIPGGSVLIFKVELISIKGK